MAAEKSSKKDLTTRQRALIKEIAKGGTHRAAAIKAGYSPKHADKAAHQALRNIQGKCPEIMDKLGLTDHSLIEN